MRQRIHNTDQIDTPLVAPVTETGYSNNPIRRLKDHRQHRRSNYIMNLTEAMFAHLYPGMFRIQQLIVYPCFTSDQCWQGEIFTTLLSQGYTENAGGFSHYPAGNSNGSAYAQLTDRHWDIYRTRAVKDGCIDRLIAILRESESKKAIQQLRYYTTETFVELSRMLEKSLNITPPQ